MNQPRLAALAILSITLNFSSAICKAQPVSEEIRAAVQKSLPYIAERGQWWMDTKKCVSCHRIIGIGTIPLRLADHKTVLISLVRL